MGFFNREKAFHAWEKIRKITLPLRKNMPVTFRSTGEVKKPFVCWMTQGDIGKTSGDVYEILKVQLF